MLQLLLLVVAILLLVAATKAQPDKVEMLAQAIAVAEGFYVPGSLPARAHNPGALRLFGETNSITFFSSDFEGWQALRDQLTRIVNGESAYYSLDMSISDFASIWTGGDNPSTWATVVSQQLGLTPYASLRQYFYGLGTSI